MNHRQVSSGASSTRRLARALPPRAAFARRLLRNGAIGFGIIVACLSLGIVGYHVCGGLGWLDALLNASMILTGMGPVDPMTSAAAKLFASFYALFSGVAFITTMGVLLAPVVHRFLHRFHLELSADAPEGQEGSKEAD
ncbi:MAG TPA: hypothetical protein VFT43_14960 [Candidatus Polarisedimenticolia bacterium]|nr:hypothetical protein [Candidatus Polarisedimenticolia bacterium]